MQLLPPAGFTAFPWKNGRGVTYDIAAQTLSGRPPGAWDDIVWRLGHTMILENGPFSVLAGFERCQMVLQGTGLSLHSADGFRRDLRDAFNPVRYPGDIALMAKLAHGPVRVLNLIAARALVDIDLCVPDIGATRVLKGGTHLVYAPDGPAKIRWDAAEVTLPAGHALQEDVSSAHPHDFCLLAGQVALATIRAVGDHLLR